VSIPRLSYTVDDYINNIGESDQVVIKLKVEVDSLRKENK